MSACSEIVGRLPEAAAAVRAVARRTPLLAEEELGHELGGTVLLKVESLQRTGSFKVRGAAAMLASLGPQAGAGVVAASAGNHAQGVALAARERGVGCEIYMPLGASVTKVDAVERLGARVHIGGATVADALARAQADAGVSGRAMVHPFDDPTVIAGQATVGDELLEDAPDIARVLVPVGGGGLASGIALALRERGSRAVVIGVQASACPAVVRSLAVGRPVAVTPGSTIADGIAVPRPGELTLAMMTELGVEVVEVDEEMIALAMAHLAERLGLVVEGAGAVGLAALLSGVVEPDRHEPTAVVLSGANVDASVLAAAVRRRETREGRRLALFVRVPDRPGGLARMLTEVAATGANVVDITHLREGVELEGGETAVQLVLETRGRPHSREVERRLGELGVRPNVMH